MQYLWLHYLLYLPRPPVDQTWGTWTSPESHQDPSRASAQTLLTRCEQHPASVKRNRARTAVPVVTADLPCPLNACSA